MIIDTHLHIVDRTALSYPWLAGAPALNRDWLLADYAAEAGPLGIGAALHMEVDVAEADIERETAHAEALAEQPGSLLRGAIAACRPEEESFPAYLERVRAQPFVKGFRRVLHVVPDAVSQGARFRENMRRLSAAGLPFDLCLLPPQIPLGLALADLAPGIQFVLDHCGVPDIKGGAMEPWREHVAAIAERPNVAAKISGVVAYAEGEAWTVETLRPYVEHVIACFGWDRVVWGSDWPVCTLGGGLTRWAEATQTLVAGASAEEKTKLFSANAARIWKLDL